MSILVKTASVLLAAGALAGIGAGAATAATPTHDGARVGAPMYTRGFTFFNDSGRTVEYTSSFSPNGGTLDSGPANGTVIAPGGSAHWEQTFWFAATTDEMLSFTELDPNHGNAPTDQTFEFDTEVAGGNGDTSSTYYADGVTNLAGSASGENLTITDDARYTRAFSFYNLSTKTLRYDNAYTTDAWLDSAPAADSILQPGDGSGGNSARFVMTYVPGRTEQLSLLFDEVDPNNGDAPTGETFVVKIQVGPDGTATSSTEIPGKDIIGTAGGDIISVMDAA